MNKSCGEYDPYELASIRFVSILKLTARKSPWIRQALTCLGHFIVGQQTPIEGVRFCISHNADGYIERQASLIKRNWLLSCHVCVSSLGPVLLCSTMAASRKHDRRIAFWRQLHINADLLLFNLPSLIVIKQENKYTTPWAPSCLVFEGL